jgi:AcrR family transcriptional regulator
MPRMPQPPAVARPPRQKRSRESLERALSAAIDVISDHGWDGLTVAEVSRRAQVSVGSLYARFGSKEDLFKAANERMLHVMDEESRAYFDGPRWASLSAHETVVAAVGGVSESIERHSGFLRGLMLRAVVDEQVSAHGSPSIHRLGHQFSRVVLEHRAAIRRPDPERAVDVCFRMVFSAFGRRLAYGPLFESPRELSWECLRTEQARACCAYLRRPGATA